MKFYHYRKIKRALDEIHNLSFYFAPLQDLNDPIEGYIRIYWQGNKSAWEGLFKNYAQSLYYALMLHYAEQLKTKPLPKMALYSQEAGSGFVTNKSIQTLCTALAKNELEISAQELFLLLQMTYKTAMDTCLALLNEKGVSVAPEEKSALIFKKKIRTIIYCQNSAEYLRPAQTIAILTITAKR